LTRRAAFIPRGLIENIGKESNELQQTPGLTQDEGEVVQVYRDRSDVPFDRYRVLLRAIPKRDLVSLTRLGERTIGMTRRRRSTPTRENQERLLHAIISYFSDHRAPTFETIEQLDPAGIADEIRAPPWPQPAAVARLQQGLQQRGTRLRPNTKSRSPW
jgi:hypothetical protein